MEKCTWSDGYNFILKIVGIRIECCDKFIIATSNRHETKCPYCKREINRIKFNDKV